MRGVGGRVVAGQVPRPFLIDRDAFGRSRTGTKALCAMQRQRGVCDRALAFGAGRTGCRGRTAALRIGAFERQPRFGFLEKKTGVFRDRDGRQRQQACASQAPAKRFLARTQVVTQNRAPAWIRPLRLLSNAQDRRWPIAQRALKENHQVTAPFDGSAERETSLLKGRLAHETKRLAEFDCPG